MTRRKPPTSDLRPSPPPLSGLAGVVGKVGKLRKAADRASRGRKPLLDRVRDFVDRPRTESRQTERSNFPDGSIYDGRDEED